MVIAEIFLFSTWLLLQGFFFYAAALQAWGGMKWYVRVITIPALAVFGAFDIVFNVFIGSIIFVELPFVRGLPDLTFSQRCCYWYKQSGWRKSIADFVASILNEISPGHIS